MAHLKKARPKLSFRCTFFFSETLHGTVPRRRVCRCGMGSSCMDLRSPLSSGIRCFAVPLCGTAPRHRAKDAVMKMSYVQFVAWSCGAHRKLVVGERWQWPRCERCAKRRIDNCNKAHGEAWWESFDWVCHYALYIPLGCSHPLVAAVVRQSQSWATLEQLGGGAAAAWGAGSSPGIATGVKSCNEPSADSLFMGAPGFPGPRRQAAASRRRGG